MPTPGTLVRGRIAGAPVDGTVAVTIPGLDPDQRFDGCVLMPRPDATPNVGDECIVLFDDTGAPWVPAWQPAP